MVEEKNMTLAFLSNLLALAGGEIPEIVMEKAKWLFLDYLGCAVAGASAIKDKCQLYVDAIGGPADDACVFGVNRKATPQTAALLNGISAHYLELDDGHRGGGIHVGATVFSALLAISKRENLSSTDFLLGSILGYEATIRLALAIQPDNKLRGYHVTGTCGTIGAALGIAVAMHLSFEQIRTVLAAAATSSAGLLEMQEDGSELKGMNVGRAAMDAIAAVYIGRAGFAAPLEPLGGKRGFLNVMSNHPKTDFLTAFAQGEFFMEKVYMKIYASCRHTHPSIEAAISIRNEHSLNVAQVKYVKAEVYKLAVFGHDHTEISSVSAAKMSIPFCIALALIKGVAGMSSFSEKSIRDKDILSLTKKVVVTENEKLTSLSPQKRSSILTIYMEDGRTFIKRVDDPKGEPENPLTRQEIMAKYNELAAQTELSTGTRNGILHELLRKDWSIGKIIEWLEEA